MSRDLLYSLAINHKPRLSRYQNPILESGLALLRHPVWMLPLVTILSLLLQPTSAFAHAILVHSTPKAHETIASGELNVELQFNSRIDAARSSLALLMPDGQVKKLAQLPQPSPAGLAAKTSRLVPGSYVLRWQVLANDGHITRGEVPFQVK
ncbi:MAG: copper resistance protein CopC [Candidatus Acidiferrales bacterium]